MAPGSRASGRTGKEPLLLTAPRYKLPSEQQTSSSCSHESRKHEGSGIVTGRNANLDEIVLFALGLVALAAARPSDIIDFEEDHMEHEQEGVPGTAVEGEYSWVAPDGNEYRVKYVADRFGYRIVDDNVVPRMRSDVPEAEEDDD
ncbi:calcification-associated peptide-2 [Penaeus vannamei]|uniref:Calcification-associated peptide-2 n=1 Tax=Penaeus vannamei TaxID=6689 RepID=A0A423SJM3_PENVA|nr:calcification-associated peptide-2 [Penaeus vannamei]